MRGGMGIGLGDWDLKFSDIQQSIRRTAGNLAGKLKKRFRGIILLGTEALLMQHIVVQHLGVVLGSSNGDLQPLLAMSIDPQP